MFIDARTVETGATLDSQICIVGAGAAGITLARELAGARQAVVLVESGGLELDAETQALYAGAMDGQALPPLDADRLRYFGGTTNHWDGSCRPFDRHDFSKRPHVERSGWPFGYETLEPFYRRAQNVCQLGPFDYEPAHWTPNGAAPLDFGADGRICNGAFQNSPPTRFGEAYRDELKAAPSVRVLLNANAVEIETCAPAREVTGVRVATLRGSRFRVTAQRYVPAAGAIETARLMLASSRVETAGLGNGHELVGRFFMDHPFTRKTSTILENAPSEAGEARLMPSDRAGLRRLIAADFASGRTVRVDGWILALSEARLCAAVALGQASS